MSSAAELKALVARARALSQEDGRSIFRVIVDALETGLEAEEHLQVKLELFEESKGWAPTRFQDY